MKRFLYQSIIFLLFFFLFAEVILLTPSTLERQDTVAEIENNKNPSSSEQRMEGVHLVEGQGDKKEWELYSISADGFIGQGVWQLKEVKVIFYARTGDFYKVVGEEGKINISTKDIDISGKVFISSTNGYEVRTDEVHYVSQDKILTIPGLVNTRGPKDKEGFRLNLKCVGMETFLENSLMIMKSDVFAERMLTSNSGQKLVKIQSGKAHISGKSNLLRFFDNVLIQYENFKVTAPEAFFAYKEKSDVPESILVNGGVNIDGMERKATAEHLKIDVTQDQYVLRGSPKVVQNGDEIIGDQITFVNGGNKVRVDKARALVEEAEDKQKE